MFCCNDANVDAHHAVLQSLADAKDATYIAAIEITGQAKLGVVRSVNRLLVFVKAKHGCEGTKGFFLGAQHVSGSA